MSKTRDVLRAISIPYKPDFVLSPEIFYGRKTAVVFPSEDEEFNIRLTFEKLDALKVCRGEYLPYELGPDTGMRPMFIVENSAWLNERHAYESAHYHDCYEWGNDVDDMLKEFDHYLLAFHDEFIEFIAAGIWFEKSSETFAPDSQFINHPLMNLAEDCIADRFEKFGIQYDVRVPHGGQSQLYENSKLCSQPLFHFALELDGESSVSSCFDVRTRNGKTRTTLTNSLGTIVCRRDGIISLEDAMALMEPYIHAVHLRRKQIGR